MVYEVKDSKGELIALHIKGDVLPEGIKFFTGAEMPIQVAQMSHPGGHLIRPHLHEQSSPGYFVLIIENEPWELSKHSF